MVRVTVRRAGAGGVGLAGTRRGSLAVRRAGRRARARAGRAARATELVHRRPGAGPPRKSCWSRRRSSARPRRRDDDDDRRRGRRRPAGGGGGGDGGAGGALEGECLVRVSKRSLFLAPRGGRAASSCRSRASSSSSAARRRRRVALLGDGAARGRRRSRQGARAQISPPSARAPSRLGPCRVGPAGARAADLTVFRPSRSPRRALHHRREPRALGHEHRRYASRRRDHALHALGGASARRDDARQGRPGRAGARPRARARARLPRVALAQIRLRALDRASPRARSSRCTPRCAPPRAQRACAALDRPSARQARRRARARRGLRRAKSPRPRRAAAGARLGERGAGGSGGRARAPRTSARARSHRPGRFFSPQGAAFYVFEAGSGAARREVRVAASFPIPASPSSSPAARRPRKPNDYALYRGADGRRAGRPARS